MEKKKYKNPEMTVVVFNNLDIITESFGGAGQGNTPGDNSQMNDPEEEP